MFKRIMVPTDASDFSKRALKTALEMARVMGSEIVLMHVIYSPEFFWGFNSPYGEMTSITNLEQNADLILDATMEGMKVDVPLKKVLKDGYPVKVILDEIEAEKIDLVIMGSHGYGLIAGSLLGSVSQRVIHHSKIPVMVVK